MSDAAIEDVLPVTPLQEGLYFEWLYRDGEQASYVLQDTLEFEGPLDADRLAGAATAVFARHPALRAGFWMRPRTGQLVQVVGKAAEPTLTTVDLTGAEAARRDTELRELLAGELRRRHDLAKPPLLRGVLVRLGPEHHVLALTYHHILLDGWSSSLLLKEIIDGYDRSLTPAEAAAAPNPYRAYGAWLASRDRAAAEAAWRDHLSGFRPGSRLAPGTAGNTALDARHLTRRMDRRATERLRALARADSLTLNTLVQTAWGLLLGRLRGSDDVVIGRTVGGRPAELPGSDSMIGMFANTVPARIRLDPDETLRELCGRLQREQSRLVRHEFMGLGAIQQLCGQRDLCDTGYAFQNLPGTARRPPDRDDGLRITPGGDNTPHYPLALMAFPDGEELTTRLTYAGSLFEEAVMEKVASALPLVLDRIAGDPHTRVGEVDDLDVVPLFRPVDEPARGRRDDGAELPQAKVAAALIGLLSEILDVPETRLGAEDDFFELGGGSLQAAHLSIQVRRTLGLELSVRQILDNPVIGDMARACTDAAPAPSRERRG
ncbi:condensation domain-containing protein [Streptomyces sp. S.PNR 29]|uniref:condensation domain-containing protein n=1 Tax=Streptomyces sp. S.PNR 29 TaxID=2973805 RepID=UPI0025AEE069|nr:condensation domain-containing protein [Streptomyces sp. S.PNR 29]MDN0197615.1 condensation domain-containing protein [Streptomyces sp. S.PNR 29]